MYEARGVIKVLGELQSFPSGFTKREFVVTTDHEKYPQDLKFEVVKERTAMLDGLAVGDRVQVFFDIRGNEYNGKYYVNLSSWKIESEAGLAAQSTQVGNASGAGRPKASQSALHPQAEDIDDDIPF